MPKSPDPAGLLELRPNRGGRGLILERVVPVEYHDNIKAAYRAEVSTRAIADWLTDNGMQISPNSVSNWLKAQKVTRD